VVIVHLPNLDSLPGLRMPNRGGFTPDAVFKVYYSEQNNYQMAELRSFPTEQISIAFLSNCDMGA
jgi:hypothetical protein